ncbi:MAG: cytochrome c [bacterium]|nr:MAG: cytochrome c [bacterium]
MYRPALFAFVTFALTGCGQAEEPAQKAAPASDAPAPAAATPAPNAAEKTAILATLPAPWNAGDLDNGRRVFARCRSCHTITEGGPNMTGPNLYGIFGQQAGARPGFNYSTALKEAGFIWDGDQLGRWLENPRTFLKGTKMSFAGIPDATDRRDVIAFLKVETGYAPSPQP